MAIDDREQKTAKRVLSSNDHQSRSDDGRKHVVDCRVVMLGPISDDQHENGEADQKAGAASQQHGVERQQSGEAEIPNRWMTIALTALVDMDGRCEQQ